MGAVDWVLLRNEAVSVGDLVSADAGGLPIYRVVAIADGQAWLQDDRRAAVQVLPLDHLRWKVSGLDN
jgi:hypothetical protein